MKAVIILFFFIFSVTTLSGQKQGNTWIFGEGAGLNFNSGVPVPISGSQIFGNPTLPGDYSNSEGAASISDSCGNLLFYSNGEKVWNKNNVIMPNGNGIMGFYSSTSAAFIIPMPSTDSLYYLFTTDGIERSLQKGLRYSVINICSDEGKGDVESSQKNILLLDTVSEKLSAVAHPNGTDIWLISHKYYSNAFYAYKITSTGIDSPIVSNIGSVHQASGGGCGAAIGQMKASSDGLRIGLVFSNTTPSVAEVFDFNPFSGVLSNVIHLNTSGDGGLYGFEFSPDNSRVYFTSMNGLFQFDITAGAGTEASINLSKTQITSEALVPCPMQLGPNGKIYVSRGGGLLGVINSPNNIGSACNFVTSSVSINPATMNTSLPLFIAGYNYKNNKIPDCIITKIDNEYLSSNQTAIYPNPFSYEAKLQSKSFYNHASLTIYNSFGEKVKEIKNFSGQTITLTRDNLQPGIYLLHIIQDNKIVSVDKLIITN